MAFLTDTDASYLREKLAEVLVRPVGLRLFTEPVGGLYVPGRRTCDTCADAEALMKEVAALSDQMHLEIIDVSTRRVEAEQWGVAHVPTIAVGPGDEVPGVLFQGLPDGYEFTSFVETLASAGSENGHGLEPETIAALAAPPPGGGRKNFGHTDSHPLGRPTSICAREFPDLARQYQVSAVPKIVLNEPRESTWSVPEAVVLEA